MSEEVEQKINKEKEDNQHNCSCDRFEEILEDYVPEESIISITLDKIHKLCEFIQSGMLQLNKTLSTLVEHQANKANELERYIELAADWQKQTADIANSTLERHALHPAIKTVDLLAGLIEQLDEQATALIENKTYCPLFKSLLTSITEAAKVARARFEYLGIQRIQPKQLEELDVSKHDLKAAVPTDDPGKHKKVERTLVPGLMYRGKVLHQAKVSVYRYPQINNQKSKGAKDGK